MIQYKMDQFSNIPKEVAVVILSDCSVKDVANSMTVSKTFYDICNDNMLWKQFIKKDDYDAFTGNGLEDYRSNCVLKKFFRGNYRKVSRPYSKKNGIDMACGPNTVPKEIGLLINLQKRLS